MRPLPSALGLFLLAAPAWPQSPPLPVGGEFQVNSYTTSTQSDPRVSLDADGDFVVVWMSYGSSGSDNSLWSIQGQRFAAGGAAQGSQFQVNSYTTVGQYRPAVSLAADGDFVVVWWSNGSSGGDTSGPSIHGQRFSADGAAQGSQFQVNSYTTGSQLDPAVSLDADGDFVVIWQSNGSSGGDTSSWSIQGQRYAAGGLAQGNQFQVNSFTNNEQQDAAVSREADGDFVVVWHSYGSSGGDSSGFSIQGQRYAASGAAQGSQFQVNSYILSQQAYPAVSVDAHGEFAVVWSSAGASSGDLSGSSIQGQRYAADGAVQGNQFQVNSYTSDTQVYPSVSVDADGDFVVVWQSDGSSGGDTSGLSVQGQRYAASGAAQGGQFQINSYTSNTQRAPVVSLGADGDFVVVWHSYGSSGGDTSGYSIRGQRFRVTGDLQGKVFFDRDFDGLQDAGEPGIAGVAVELYDDALNLRRTRLTDGNGEYDLKPKEGTWHVRFVRPSAYSFTARDVGADDAIDSDADPSDGETDPFPVAVNVAATPLDAGLTNGVGDKVWNDLDHDGRRDGGEPGLAGVTVRLRDKGGNEVSSTTSDGSGFYHFNDMDPGLYYVDFDAPSGFAFSPADQGGDDEADSDADEATGNSQLFTFELAEIDTSIDAGMYQLSSIGGRVWDDLDRDGLREAGEPGIGNLLMRLLDSTGTTVLASQATDAGGFYAFEELAAATYVVEVVPLGALDLSPQNVGGDDSIDSDFDPLTARTAPLPFTAGTVVANVDAGLQVVVLFVDGFESGDLERWGS